MTDSSSMSDIYSSASSIPPDTIHSTDENVAPLPGLQPALTV